MANKTLREIYAKNMRTIRSKLSLSQEALAERAKMHRNYPGKIERCELNIRVEMMNKIAKALNTSICVLLGGSVIPTRRVKITTILAENTKKIRLEQGLSQDMIHKRGFQRTYISSIEQGRNVSIDTIEKLAKVLKVKPYKLFE
ncbi:hypothetical protein ADMFC3_23630 [Geovibrio sp. ADMFC3]